MLRGIYHQWARWKIPNPEYSTYNKKDQYLLSWINMSLSPFVLSTAYGLHTSRQVWSALSTRFASQSKSQVSHLKRQLQWLQQGSKSCTEYLRLVKSIADQLDAVGKPADDEDLISFIMRGLNPHSIPSSHPILSVLEIIHQPLPIFKMMSWIMKCCWNNNLLLLLIQIATLLFHMQRQGSNSSNFNRRPFQKDCFGPPFHKHTNSTSYGPKSAVSRLPSSGSQSNNMLFSPSSQSSHKTPCQICGKTQPSSLRLFPHDGLLLPGKALTKSPCCNGCTDQQYPWRIGMAGW